MTIAIGMLYQGGVQLAADTLVSTSTLGWHESKILGYRYTAGDVLFAMAGNVHFADAAIQRTAEVLVRSFSQRRSKSDMANSVQKSLAKEYRSNVREGQMYGGADDYWLLVAIRSVDDGLDLYCTYQTSMRRVRSGFECIGAGQDLAKVVIKPSYKPGISRDQAWCNAGYALSTTKTAMPGIVGGNLVMAFLEENGKILFSNMKSAELLECYCAFFDASARAALDAFMDIDNEERFERQMGYFNTQVKHFRKEWQKEQARTLWSADPPESLGVIKDYR